MLHYPIPAIDAATMLTDLLLYFVVLVSIVAVIAFTLSAIFPWSDDDGR